MTKLEELVEWHKNRSCDDDFEYYEIMDKARQLLAEEKAEEQKATADESKTTKESCAWHDLKVVSPHWEALQNNTKPFEVRKNDRGYKVGDGLILRHWANGEYVVNEAPQYFVVTHITDYPDGLKDGYVVLGISRHRPDDNSEEPLACLAARKKGVRCVKIWPYMSGGFAIDIDCDDGLHGHEDDTLGKAEAKARQYLLALPDKGEGK